jgi:hypothetical protein
MTWDNASSSGWIFFDVGITLILFGGGIGRLRRGRLCCFSYFLFRRCGSSPALAVLRRHGDDDAVDDGAGEVRMMIFWKMETVTDLIGWV